MSTRQEKPALSFWQIWNMCFGFLGIQFGFALQNSNVSRIFQTLGADMEMIPVLWMAAPLTGLLVQPIIGYFSDQTWNRLGRRRPYFLWGAIIATIPLLVMPNSPILWIAVGTLWILDAALNITMEPFRAFVGDMLPSRQRTLGYVMQTVFIGVGAVMASSLPYIFTNWIGVDNTAPAGEIPDSVRYSFYLGGLILFTSVMWTVARTREYNPELLAAFEETEGAAKAAAEQSSLAGQAVFSTRVASIWSLVGLATTAAVLMGQWDKQLYILTLGVFVYGALQFYAASIEAREKLDNRFYDACRSMALMPTTMRQLAVVQFFSWFPLLAMWVYTTGAVTAHHFGSSDTTSMLYNQGANWVGVLFSVHNGFTVLAAILIPSLTRMVGLKTTHQINLLLGATGLGSFMIIKDPTWLLLSMVGVGFAWASILSVPYAILSDAVPANKMGFYMGVFNFFIVIPQLVAASVLGLALKYLFSGQAIYVLGLGAALWVVAAITVFFVKHHDQESKLKINIGMQKV